MRLEVQCPCCQRTGGSPAGGAAINTIGCTGACLHWAVQLISNPLFWEEEPGNWQAWAFEHLILPSWFLFTGSAPISMALGADTFSLILLKTIYRMKS